MLTDSIKRTGIKVATCPLNSSESTEPSNPKDNERKHLNQNPTVLTRDLWFFARLKERKMRNRHAKSIWFDI
jgi:hypothetical protein